jgi:uncharacterized membrane protein (UPF0127 family)
MAAWQLVERVTGQVVVETLEIADRYWSRLWGLQFRKTLEPGCGLLLVPCSSIHTACVRFPIDVVLLDRGGRVLGVRSHLRPWRMMAGAPGTHAILELPAGAASVQPGETLALRLSVDAVSGPFGKHQDATSPRALAGFTIIR